MCQGWMKFFALRKVFLLLCTWLNTFSTTRHQLSFPNGCTEIYDCFQQHVSPAIKEETEEMSTLKTCPHQAQGSKLYIKQHIIFACHLPLMCWAMWQQLWQEQWRFLTRNLQSVLANEAERLWDEGHASLQAKSYALENLTKLNLQGLIWLRRQGTSMQLGYCQLFFLSLGRRSFIYLDSGICFSNVSSSCFSFPFPQWFAHRIIK